MTIALISLQLLLVYAGRLFFRNDYHPAVIYSIFWALILISTCLFGGSYYFSSEAYLVILAVQAVFIAGGVIGAAHRRGAKNSSNYHIRLCAPRTVMLMSVPAGILAIGATLTAGDFSFSQALALSAIGDVSREMSVARYTEQFRVPMTTSICQMFVFFCLLVSGLDAAKRSTLKERCLNFVPFLPLLVLSIILTTRATVLFGLLLWSAAYLSGRLLEGKLGTTIVTPKAVTISVALTAAIAFLFVSLQLLRGGITDLSRIPEILNHLRKWPFGSIAGFSIWYDSHTLSSTTNYGYFTFTGIFDLLGIRGRESGLYTDYVDLGLGDYGNIYTSIRGLIQDFSLPGTLLLFFGFGWLSSVSFSKVADRKVLWIPILSCIYCFLLWSPIVSFFAYTGHIVAAVLFFGYLSLSKRQIRAAHDY